MAKQATKLAPEPETRALAKIPDVDSFQQLLDSIPRYNEIKSRTGTEQAILAADDFHSGKLDGLQFLAAAVNAAEAFTKIILDSKAYVNKYRDMFKINSSMSKQHPDRMKWTALGVKTFRDFGIEVPEGITYTANGKEVAVTSDDPIGWTNFCYVVVKRSPQHVNNKFAETSKTIGSTYLPEPESHPSPIPTNIAAPVTPPPTGVTTSYKLVPNTDDDEEVEDDETLLNKLGDRLGKANLTKCGSMEFNTAEIMVTLDDGGQQLQSYVVWGKAGDQSADDVILATKKREKEEATGEGEGVMDQITQMLQTELVGGRKLISSLHDIREEMGIKAEAMYKAKRQLHLVTTNEAGDVLTPAEAKGQSGLYWGLPTGDLGAAKRAFDAKIQKARGVMMENEEGL
jgi:hypothetical protein